MNGLDTLSSHEAFYDGDDGNTILSASNIMTINFRTYSNDNMGKGFVMTFQFIRVDQVDQVDATVRKSLGLLKTS